MDSKEIIIKAENISKIYKSGEIETIALKRTNFNVYRGEFISIIGPSGAGKSTLLYQLGLLDSPSEGYILLNEVNTTKLSEPEKTALRLDKLGYVFQNYSLLPELNAIDNIKIILIMQGMRAGAAKSKAMQVLDRMGLKNRAKHFPGQLSGGEQQRVSIARAIAHNPDILFADEPTANLDSAASQIIIDYLKELNEAGQTIIMVTHEKQFSDQAKRKIEMKDGHIITDVKITPIDI